MSVEIPIEKEWYYVFNERYKGKMPPFFEESQFKEAAYIKSKYAEIKSEIESYFSKDIEHELKPGLIPHASWDGAGWASIGLYGFGFKKNANCKKFPVITKIVESIPSMTSAQISVLKPGASLKPHIDDTSAVVRIHLGIKIPGQLPDIGFRMCRQNVGWSEGEILIINASRPHYTWNNTKEHRIVFIVDVVHQQYLDRKLRICGNVLVQLVMKMTAARFPFLKNMSKTSVNILQKTLGFGAYTILLFRRTFNI